MRLFEVRTWKPQRIREVAKCAAVTSGWARVSAAYLGAPALPWPFRFETRAGGVLSVADWDDLSTIWHVFCAEDYDLPATARTVVDLGANIGAFAVWAAERCPAARIVCVEPYPPTFDRLRANIEASGIERRVDMVDCAIGPSDETALFQASESIRAYSRRLVGPETSEESIEVECVSLETLMVTEELEEIDCLKMDVEGAEHAIIGSSSVDTIRRCRLITLEYHGRSEWLSSAARLRECGFEAKKVLSFGWSGVATFSRM